MRFSRSQLAGSAFVLAWFVYFAWSGLGASFAPDDMMNLHGYWRAGPWQAIASQFQLGINTYRPLGALFYLPLFAVFGLNPLPFRIVVFAVLAGNVWLAYRVARRLGVGEAAAGVAALIVCYHAAMSDIYHFTSVIYDVLCFTFYCATFLYYTGRRMAGSRRWAAFLGLYVCALNAKEMAVTLPAMLLVWEWLYRPRRDGRSWGPLLAAGAITAVYIAGRKFGADPLMAMEAYRPVFTLERYLESSRHIANELVYSGGFFDTRRLLLFWAVLAYTAWRRPRPELRFGWAMTMIAPLPVVFLQGRVHSNLYLPLLGWAVLAGVLVVDVAGALAAWLEGEPVIGRAGRRALQGALLALAVVLLFRVTAAQKRRRMADVLANGTQTAEVVAQFRAANPQVPPRSRVLLVDDPFHDWDALFIADLWFGDRSVDIRLQNKTPLREDEIRKDMQYVFRFEPGRLVRVKP